MSKLVPMHSTQYEFCVFVVYHDEDDWTRKELLRLLDENSIRFCCLEKDSNPGQLEFENVDILLQQSRKVLFVISAEFCRDTQSPLMAAVVLTTHAKEMIITLITDGELSCKNVLFKLRHTQIIQKDSDDWKDMLITEIISDTLEFCQLLSTGDVSKHLLNRGLSLQDFESDIFGLSLVVRRKHFKVDLEEFSKHLKVHQKYQTTETCRQCNNLYNVDSIVSIIINTDVTLVQPTDELIEAFGRLCQHVLDASSLRSTFSHVCTVSGPFQPSEQKFVTKLYEEAYDTIGVEFRQQLKGPWAPEFVDYEKRVESFQDVWQELVGPSAEMMAKAGYYFHKKPSWTHCFFCGSGYSTWNKDDDPLMVHARYSPTCGFLRQYLPREDNPGQKVRRYFVPVEKFKSYLHRKQSFDNFDVTRYWKDAKKEKEDIICRLATCGFFYKGEDAEIMCFACGLGIMYTDYTIEPCFLHAQFSSDCPYLRSTNDHYNLEILMQAKRLTSNQSTVVNFFLKKYDGDHRLKTANVFKPCKRLQITEL